MHLGVASHALPGYHNKIGGLHPYLEVWVRTDSQSGLLHARHSCPLRQSTSLTCIRNHSKCKPQIRTQSMPAQHHTKEHDLTETALLPSSRVVR